MSDGFFPDIAKALAAAGPTGVTVISSAYVVDRVVSLSPQPVT